MGDRKPDVLLITEQPYGRPQNRLRCDVTIVMLLIINIPKKLISQ